MMCFLTNMVINPLIYDCCEPATLSERIMRKLDCRPQIDLVILSECRR